MIEEKNKYVVGVLSMESFCLFEPANCNKIIEAFDNDVDKLIEELNNRNYEVESFIIGCESGVQF